MLDRLHDSLVDGGDLEKNVNTIRFSQPSGELHGNLHVQQQL